MDSRIILAGSIVFAALVAVWIFRFETFGSHGIMHKNRITGAVCGGRDRMLMGSMTAFLGAVVQIRRNFGATATNS